ncbi:MAG: hemerythrin domain-containing protein [Actinomycetota bacterium]|nr:hemerythrin domain-containing protein [Actinomycetota bacterium]
MSDTDIDTLILSEHEVFRREFARLEGLEGDELREAWDRLAEQLEVHAAGEEAVFYPHVVRRLPDGEADTEHALRDHNEIRTSAQAVAEQEVGTEAWWEAVRTAQEANSEHMAEEERDVLGDVKERIGSAEREELGMAWLQFHDEHERARGLSGEPEDPQAYIEEHRA